jgi:hypothetical protein
MQHRGTPVIGLSPQVDAATNAGNSAVNLLQICRSSGIDASYERDAKVARMMGFANILMVGSRRAFL